jgi:hypothetical protein
MTKEREAYIFTGEERRFGCVKAEGKEVQMCARSMRPKLAPTHEAGEQGGVPLGEAERVATTINATHRVKSTACLPASPTNVSHPEMN